MSKSAAEQLEDEERALADLIIVRAMQLMLERKVCVALAIYPPFAFVTGEYTPITALRTAPDGPCPREYLGAVGERWIRWQHPAFSHRLTFKLNPYEQRR